jgi:hypothetical protein
MNRIEMTEDPVAEVGGSKVNWAIFWSLSKVAHGDFKYFSQSPICLTGASTSQINGNHTKRRSDRTLVVKCNTGCRQCTTT